MKLMSLKKKFALSQKNKVNPYNVVIVGTEIHNAGYLNCKDNEINRVTTSQPKVWGSNFKFKSVLKHCYLTLSEYVFLFVYIIHTRVCLCVCSVVSDSLPLHGL